MLFHGRLNIARLHNFNSLLDGQITIADKINCLNSSQAQASLRAIENLLTKNMLEHRLLITQQHIKKDFTFNSMIAWAFITEGAANIIAIVAVASKNTAVG